MPEVILKVDNLSKSFGALMATDSLNLEVDEGEIHAIIGPNGAGKTTLVHQLSGLINSDTGSIHFNGRDITNMSAPNRCHAGMVRSFQITSILKNFSVLDNVALSIQARQGHSFKFWKAVRTDNDLKDPARQILEEIGLADQSGTLAGNLAHGDQRRLEIAVALATSPKLLLLDEPMAGMGQEGSEQMIGYLKSLKGKYTMVLIEHDMDAVFALADRITVLVYGQAIASGAPGEIRSNPEVRQAYLGED